jgi:hypothetical protein
MYSNLVIKFKKFLVEITVILIVIIIGLTTYLNKSYIPGSDEARQIESAIYLKNGYGLVTPIKFSDKYSSRDFGELNTRIKGETKEFIYQTNWPPGYSLLIVLFLSIGFLPLTAGLIVKILCTLIALGGLISLARQLFQTLSFRLFYIILISSFIYIYYKVSPSDLLILGFFCYITKIIFSQTDLGKDKKYCINIGILIALSIAFKYSAIFILLFAFLYICSYKLYFEQKDTLRISLALTLLPSVFLLLVIFIFNLHQTGALSKNVLINPINLSAFPLTWLVAPFDALFFKSTMISSGFIKSLFFNNPILIASLKILIILIYVAILFVFLRNNTNQKINKFLFLFLAGFISNFLFLFLLTYIFFDRNAPWTPVEDGRYYLPQIPLLFGVALLIVKNKINIKFVKNNISKIILATLFLIYLLSICIFEIYWNKNIKSMRNNASDVHREIKYLKENNPHHKLVIFTDDDFHRSSLDFIPEAIFYLEAYNKEWNPDIDGKAIVLLICTPTYRLNHQKIDDYCKNYDHINTGILFGFNNYRQWNGNNILIKRYD